MDDSGADQCIVNLNSFLVYDRTGIYFNVDGATGDMTSCTPLELVNEAYTLATVDGKKVIFRINQAFCDLDRNANEALLATHQVRDHGLALDNCARRHLDSYGRPGGQCLITPAGQFNFLFNGKTCFFSIERPTPDDIATHPVVELTSSASYEPDVRRRSVRRRKFTDDDVATWRARLGYPTFEVTRDTLENTTQMVKTLQAETREYLRDFHKTRVHCLRPKRVDDDMYSDTFFSNTTSIRGFKMFQLFCYKYSKYNVMKLLRREATVSVAYEDTIIEHGAPSKIITDNAKSLTSNKFKDVSRKYCIKTGNSVPHSQHQNFAEGEGGNFKFAVQKLLHNTPHAPKVYWCFAAGFTDKVRRHLSKQSLNGRSAIEKMNGSTTDISIFRFPWFSAVWFYDPLTSFPKDKMSAGFFLDIAENTGDGFSYVILPVAKVEDIPTDRCYPIVRNIVRPRSLSDLTSPEVRTNDGNLTFFNADGEELFTEEELNIDDIEDVLEDQRDVTPREIENLTSDFIDDDNIRDRDAPSFVDGAIPTIPEIEEISELDETEPPVPAAPVQVAPTTAMGPLPTTGEPSSKRQRPDDNAQRNVPIISQDSDDYDSTDEFEVDNVFPVDPDSHEDFDQMASRLNVVFDPDEDKDRDLDSIIDHRTVCSTLELLVKYSTGNGSMDEEWHPIGLVKDEDPHAVATYVMNTDLGQVMNGIQRRWARNFLRSLKVTLRRMRRTCNRTFEARTFNPTAKKPTRGSHLTRKQRRSMRKLQKQKGSSKSKATFKYGIEVPKNWKDIVRIDAAAGNTKWQDSVKKEVGALIQHGCFKFMPKDFKPPKDYQYCRLHFVYEVKTDLRQKSRLVCDGSRVDPKGLSTRATVVKGISVRLLDLIAESQSLKVLCGDIGNAFIQANTQEKVYTRVGDEFGEHAGKIAFIVRALYGLTTSAERFHTLLADFLRTLGFIPTRFDRDVWMRLREDESGYDYICTHVDDFKVVAKEPMIWIDRIASAFLIKEHGPRKYYLGNDYTYHDEQKIWTYGCQTYAKEAIAKVERMFGVLPKESTPLPKEDCHPELDESPLLNLDGHRKFQMLLGMLQWMVTIGRPDLCNLVSSLNRFGACPREYHLDLAVRAFGYVKQVKDPKIGIDSRPLQYERIFPDYEKLIPDFLQDYPEAKEEIAAHFPKSFGPVMETTIMVDADHAHDQKTRRSLTGLLAFVGSTPVIWLSKRQGAIASSTYAAEFSALRTATEEAISLRYMLRCLGCNVPTDGSCPTKIFGDNLSVIQSAANPAADISKKHVAISFHTVREAIAARIVEAYWLQGKYNLSDIMTKQIPKTEFCGHCKYIFWRPDFHLHRNNRLDEDYCD